MWVPKALTLLPRSAVIVAFVVRGSIGGGGVVDVTGSGRDPVEE